MTDQPAQGSTADYCSAWPSDVPERNNHHLITHMRGGALASVQRCQFCGWIDFADLDEQVRAQADAAYERGLAEGRRQATEGWEREWGIQLAGDAAPVPCPSEADGRRQLDRGYWPSDAVLVSRLVGPPEPAEQHEGGA